MDSLHENGEFHGEILEPNILIKEDPSEEMLEPNVLIKEEPDDNEDYLDYLNAGYPDISTVGTGQHLGLYETSTKRKFNGMKIICIELSRPNQAQLRPNSSFDFQLKYVLTEFTI